MSLLERRRIALYKSDQQQQLHKIITLRVPGEIKRREVELDPQVSSEEIMSKEVELGCES